MSDRKSGQKLIKRRDLLAAGLTLPLLPRLGLAADAAPATRTIPSTGEAMPVIGLGTSRTFDVKDDMAARAALVPVLQAFFDRGGRLIDSSPMYGSAEEVTGWLLGQLKGGVRPFMATKVWTDGEDAGREQMAESARLLATPRIDLMQIHNLRDWRTHLKTLRAWKEEGRIRYIGITTSFANQYADFEAVMRAENFDFVQVNYSAGERESENVLLPLAADRGMAVLVNRPFMRSELFAKVKGKPLPGFAADYGCTSWGQVFLKFAWSHPAVTCVIPATAKLSHMEDNMAAAFGAAPDEAFRRAVLAAVA
jgi:diketogulonate reductase-like aldo/keto reductase